MIGPSGLNVGYEIATIGETLTAVAFEFFFPGVNSLVPFYG